MENSSLPDQSLTDNHTPLNFQSIMEESYVTIYQSDDQLEGAEQSQASHTDWQEFWKENFLKCREKYEKSLEESKNKSIEIEALGTTILLLAKQRAWEILGLQRLIAVLNNQCQSQTLELLYSHDKMDFLRSQLKDAKNELSSNTRVISSLKKMNTRKNKKISELKEEITEMELDGKLHKANAENKEEVLVEKAKIQSVKKKFGTLRSNLDVETLDKVKRPVPTRLRSKTEKLSSLKNSLAFLELDLDIPKAQSENIERQTQVGHFEPKAEEISALKNAIIDLRAKLTTLTQKSLELSYINDDHMQTMEQLKRREQSLKERLAEKDAQIEMLNNSLTEINSNYANKTRIQNKCFELMQENHQKQIQRLQSQINGCSETEENLVKLVPMEFAEEIEQLKMNLKLTSSKLQMNDEQVKEIKIKRVRLGKRQKSEVDIEVPAAKHVIIQESRQCDACLQVFDDEIALSNHEWLCTETCMRSLSAHFYLE